MAIVSSIGGGGGGSLSFEQIKANWNETNPDSLAFIENKPFYEEDGSIDIVPTILLEGFEMSPDFNVPVVIFEDSNLTLVVGETYIVEWDGTVFTCVG